MGGESEMRGGGDVARGLKGRCGRGVAKEGKRRGGRGSLYVSSAGGCDGGGSG